MILDAPCIFCGYNGEGYWQAGTHAEGCPWKVVAGMGIRMMQVREVIAQLWTDWHDDAAHAQEVAALGKRIDALRTMLTTVLNTTSDRWLAQDVLVALRDDAALAEARKGQT